MHAKSGLRVVLKWEIFRPDSVIAAVIRLLERNDHSFFNRLDSLAWLAVRFAWVNTLYRRPSFCLATGCRMVDVYCFLRIQFN